MSAFSLGGRAGSAPRPRTALRTRLRQFPLPLAAILLAALLNAIAWSYATPPLQAPDEPAHVAYVQHLAETGHPPKRNADDYHVYSTEQGTAMLLQALNTLPTVGNARPSWSPADEAELRRLGDDLPASGRKDGTGPNPAAQNPPLYYAFACIPYWAGRALGLDFTGRLMLIRWATSLFYLAIIALTWVLVGELMAATWLRVVATSVVALIPQLAFIGTIVNPDIMLAAIWTAFLTLAVRMLKRGPTARSVLGVGALTAASALTHGRGLLLLPPAIVLIGLAFLKYRPGWRAALTWSGGAAGLVAAGGLVALLVTRSASGGAAFGGVATANSAGTSVRGLADYVWQFYLGRRGLIGPRIGPDYGFRQVFVESFLGRFGSLDAGFSKRVYDGLQALVLLGLAGFLGAAFVRRRWIAEHWQLVVVLVLTPLSLLGGLHLIAYRQLAAGSVDPILQGRYLLVCVSLVGLAVAAICATLPRRVGAVLAAAVLSIGVLLSIGGLGVTVLRFYV
ncbi:DUF2142 domain-containing protein [Conexibacter sp. CPCC 206217]|uniref:DUF2142 domain-containing protein n=1 Tax=Conexibacter sp. CPCC 206217 TaxID=3064574 RepID=UPI002719EAB5|nr:DUF2142 domain-containing protein [Conexibacter sp. CPCC 206217]MDO8210012.1 DUF2142 domain-containing protein [Conexibacter sp. CPCC 206217]